MDSSEMDWLSLGGGLALTACALVAIQSRDTTALRSSWAAIDIVEFMLLFFRLRNRDRIDNLIMAFALRFIGIILFLWGTSNVTVLLIAAGIRMIVTPAGFLKDEDFNLPRCMIVFLTFISPLSSFIVFARIATSIDPSAMSLFLFVLLLGIGVLAGIGWFNAPTGFVGRGYWVLALSSFVVLAAMRGLLIASILWGIAMVLSGGILFFDEKISKRPIFFYIGMLAITSIPYMPTWDGASLYTTSLGISLVFFILIQSLLIGGYIKHINIDRPQLVTTERWILLINPLRLLIVVSVYWLVAFLYWRDGVLLRNSLPWLLYKNTIDYFIGFVIGAGGLFFYWIWRSRDRFPKLFRLPRFQWTSFGWIVKGANVLFQFVGNVVDGLSAIVEGESGILLTLLLLALLITFFIQGR